jgi:hypothetical protein
MCLNRNKTWDELPAIPRPVCTFCETYAFIGWNIDRPAWGAPRLPRKERYT